jgi:hypothetical protein
VRALVAGPPPWAIRKRRIEDLEKTIANRLAALATKLGSFPTPWPRLLERQRTELNALIDAHNLYYPIEANLPCDPLAGELLEGSLPFRPLAHREASDLVDLAKRVMSQEDEDENKGD